MVYKYTRNKKRKLQISVSVHAPSIQHIGYQYNTDIDIGNIGTLNKMSSK